jgi:hypothetical protein
MFIALAIYACSEKSDETKAAAEQSVVSGTARAPSVIDSAVATFNPTRGDFDEDRAEDVARDYLSDEAYQVTVGSAACTDDCSGHEAGWRWAAEGNSCGSGESESFDAGCAAFEEAVEERVAEAKQRYDDGDDTFAGA